MLNQPTHRVTANACKTGVRFLIIAVIVLTTAPLAHAQYFANQSYWKNERHAFTLGIGVTNFLGELGGRDAVGSDFIFDLETSMFRPALHVEYSYRVARRVAIKGGFHYGIIAGNDALTEEPFRKNRNIHFKSNVFELSVKGEFRLLESKPRARYKLIGVKSRRAGGELYVFGGIGITYFNPKANYNGEWVELKPLGTEGQNFSDGIAPYSNFTPVFPLGFGYRHNVTGQLSIGLEIAHRITLTDYMDDTSGKYYDKGAILAQDGPVAAHFSDPSLGYRTNPDGGVVPMKVDPLQRGDPEDNDSYFFVVATISYKLTPTRMSHRGKIRVTRKRSGKIIF